MFRLMRTRSWLVALVCLTLVSSTLFTPALKSPDGQTRAFVKGSSIALASCSMNCPPQQPPVMIGFGGLRLDSATVASTACSVCYKNSTFVASNVFPGQSQSDTERTVVKMKAMGFNTIRVSFAPYCTSPSGDGHSDSPYSFTDAQNTIKIASYYHFWIVLRYAGNDDIATQTTCWLNYWQSIIQQLGPLYGQFIWEPVNEPSVSVSILSANYQLWINMARGVGDQHFIVVENQCSRSCPYWGDISKGYPIVSDSLGKVLISFHNYYSYLYNTWTVQSAISTAQSDFQAILKGEQLTGWSALDTEGGPSFGVSTCNGSSGTTSGCPPGTYLPGSAGYANVSLAYIQTLTSLFDRHSPRINWVWWPVGTWIDTECSGSFGALQPAYCPGGTGYSGGVGWGNLLHYVPVNATSTPLALLASFRIAPTSVSTSTSINFSAQAIGGITPYVFSWSFGDGTSASGPTSAHSYATPGNFTVTLIASDSSNQTASTSQVVDVHSAQQPPGGGGVCVLCSLGPLLPMLFILTIGIASGLSTVVAVFFARKRSRGRQEKVLARTYLRNGKTSQNYAT
jgi:hypothetical protein